jgi:RimJ/RimL family protein N-acetyltransferase
MTEAVIPVTDLAFDTLGFDKLILSNAVGNRGSARVKEKCGAHKIGEKPSSFVDPTLTASELWELTKESWRAHKASLQG